MSLNTPDDERIRNAEVRTSKYLNNLIEQDHRRVKQRMYPILGFKSFRNATVTIGAIELAQKIRAVSSTLQR